MKTIITAIVLACSTLVMPAADAAKYKDFAAKMGAKFTLAHDSAHKAADFFSPPSMPSSYLTDHKGVIRHVHTGYCGAKTETECVAEIEALLAEK